MKDFPQSCVVDANVVIKLFLVEDHTESVRAYFAELLDTQSSVTVHVPDLLYAECANILWKQVRWSGYDAQQAQQDLVDLYRMHLPATPASELMTSALEIACTYGTSAYDACYVALAKRLSLPLLTSDARLANMLANTPYNVITLDSLVSAPIDNV